MQPQSPPVETAPGEHGGKSIRATLYHLRSLLTVSRGRSTVPPQTAQNVRNPVQGMDTMPPGFAVYCTDMGSRTRTVLSKRLTWYL